MAQPLIDSPSVQPFMTVATTQYNDDPPRPQEEPDEAPETPIDDPAPVPVQDPPAEPDQPPYVVRTRAT